MIQAKVIADSKNEFGNRITTMIVTFPRIILAEFNTHRMFSRNSASSRAIPFEKMMKMVNENFFIPLAWQIDHKGMQGTEYLTAPIDVAMAHDNWLEASKNAIRLAKNLNNNCHVTKQLCNRLLEPFMYHTVIVTATEWENFFALRCPKYESETGNQFRSKRDFYTHSLDSTQAWMEDSTSLEWLQINKGQAEIHMMALAEAMWDAYNESISKELKAGEWHIPFGDNMNESEIYKIASSDVNYKLSEFMDKALPLTKIKIATARCARVSYTVVGEEGKPDNYENDIKLHDRLASSGHWSPFEHCAKIMNPAECNSRLFISNGGEHGWSGNFRGFIQYRKMFNNENITE